MLRYQFPLIYEILTNSSEFTGKTLNRPPIGNWVQKKTPIWRF
ncbi:hypothetical protein SOHN41_00853 [Shewanella sp. HN-41]|nr:hypothetical protein SOHN41_00853 [Shewanella sp. HN-41]